MIAAPARRAASPPHGHATVVAAAPAAARAADPVRDALVFTAIVAGSALLLQRFGIPAGAKAINVVGPIGLGAAGVFLLRGTLSLSVIRLCMFLLLAAWAAVGLAYHSANPGLFSATPSLQSLLQFLVMCSFATLSFTHKVSERRFFGILTRLLAVVAVAGLLQFAAQFVGVRIFSFRGIVPAPLLFEAGYNLVIGSGVGSLLKSNGFFLLEPSIFSQFMALAVIIELLTTRRPVMLALFMAGFLVSMAGTGWIVLATFVASAVFSMGARGVVLAAATVALVAILLAGLHFAAPDVLASLGERLNETSRQSTSGHLRFITPFWVLDDVLSRDPIAALVGIGAGVSERLILPYEYDVNTPIKIGLEYGLPALLAYIGMVVLGPKSPVQGALLAPGLVMLMFTGAYQQFPPVLFFVLLTISVARLEPDPVRPLPIYAGTRRADAPASA